MVLSIKSRFHFEFHFYQKPLKNIGKKHWSFQTSIWRTCYLNFQLIDKGCTTEAHKWSKCENKFVNGKFSDYTTFYLDYPYVISTRINNGLWYINTETTPEEYYYVDLDFNILYIFLNDSAWWSETHSLMIDRQITNYWKHVNLRIVFLLFPLFFI